MLIDTTDKQTEDSRLHAVADGQHYSHYAYDHGGERRLKLTGDRTSVDANASAVMSRMTLDELTLYPSPYLVMTRHGYTKHYYAGAERVAASIGRGGLNALDTLVCHSQRLQATADGLFGQSLSRAEARELPEYDLCCLSENPFFVDGLDQQIDNIPKNPALDFAVDLSCFAMAAQRLQSPQGGQAEHSLYIYHSDHLGSASWITDYAGNPVQHLQYLPYGEEYVNQRNSSYSERYLFTGKERDKETGYGYFGARYMDHELMTMWLSVDPMADKYPSISPYAYCAWNPIKLIDPDGMDTIKVYLDKGSIERTKAKGDHNVLYYKNEEIAYSDQIQEDKCKFGTMSWDYEYTEDNEKFNCRTEHLFCSDNKVGEQIFKKIAELGSPVEWDYYSIKMGESYGGDLSSSGIKDKMIHSSGMYTAINVGLWNHYHPNNNIDSFFPSYSDQNHAKELKGARCTIFCNGLSMDFQKYVPSHTYGYINIGEFRQLWNRFAR